MLVELGSKFRDELSEIIIVTLNLRHQFSYVYLRLSAITPAKFIARVFPVEVNAIKACQVRSLVPWCNSRAVSSLIKRSRYLGFPTIAMGEDRGEKGG